MIKNSVVSVRLNQSTTEKLKAVAQAKEVKLSNYLRNLIIKDLY